ncbi:hypothetical protein [uncultured Alistipes sp.]|uniref:phosphorylase family protein n=1 Tax=uncultured Alistipes sp. TaxID=538949 RepID=UPI0032B26838
MKIVYLFPTVEEAKGFLLTEPKYPVFVTGVGQAAVAAGVIRAVKSKKPDLVILAGLAGSYDSELAYGEVVEVVREQVAGIPDRYAESYAVEPLTELRTVRSLTVDRSGGGTEFAAKASAQVENMEGAALFAVCDALGVECAELRAISNRVGEPFKTWHTEEALANLTEILTQTVFE